MCPCTFNFPTCHGPLQAACSPKELKELASEPGIMVHAAPDQMAVSEADEATMKATRMKRRIVDIIKQVWGIGGRGGGRRGAV